MKITILKIGAIILFAHCVYSMFKIKKQYSGSCFDMPAVSKSPATKSFADISITSGINDSLFVPVRPKKSEKTTITVKK